MFGANFKRKYALSDNGVKNARKGILWTVIVNLIVMGGIGIIYFLMSDFMDTHVDGEPLPEALKYIALVIVFIVLSFITHLSSIRQPMAWFTGRLKP